MPDVIKSETALAEKDWVEAKKDPALLKDHPSLSRPIPKEDELAKAEAARRPTAADATINLPGTSSTTWEAFVDHTHTPTDILDPLYWGERISDIEAGDFMNVEPNDGAWLATIRVMEIEKAAGRVLVEPVGKLTVFTRLPPPEGFEIEFVSRLVGFRVTRDQGRKVLRTGCKSYQGAYAWLVGTTGDTPRPAKKV